jgi:hypothetical protein
MTTAFVHDASYDRLVHTELDDLRHDAVRRFTWASLVAAWFFYAVVLASGRLFLAGTAVIVLVGAALIASSKLARLYVTWAAALVVAALLMLHGGAVALSPRSEVLALGVLVIASWDSCWVLVSLASVRWSTGRWFSTYGESH